MLPQLFTYLLLTCYFEFLISLFLRTLGLLLAAGKPTGEFEKEIRAELGSFRVS